MERLHVGILFRLTAPAELQPTASIKCQAGEGAILDLKLS